MTTPHHCRLLANLRGDLPLTNLSWAPATPTKKSQTDIFGTSQIRTVTLVWWEAREKIESFTLHEISRKPSNASRMNPERRRRGVQACSIFRGNCVQTSVQLGRNRACLASCQLSSQLPNQCYYSLPASIYIGSGTLQLGFQCEQLQTSKGFFDVTRQAAPGADVLMIAAPVDAVTPVDPAAAAAAAAAAQPPSLELAMPKQAALPPAMTPVPPAMTPVPPAMTPVPLAMTPVPPAMAALPQAEAEVPLALDVAPMQIMQVVPPVAPQPVVPQLSVPVLPDLPMAAAMPKQLALPPESEQEKVPCYS